MAKKATTKAKKEVVEEVVEEVAPKAKKEVKRSLVTNEELVGKLKMKAGDKDVEIEVGGEKFAIHDVEGLKLVLIRKNYR